MRRKLWRKEKQEENTDSKNIEEVKKTAKEILKEEFKNVIKLRMLNEEEDNFNKAIYNNEIITVYGEILNPRSMGVLYLYPYNIKSGKQVEKSYADYLFADPTYEIGYKNGTAYMFYGMGIKLRESTNVFFEDNISIGMYETKTMKEYGKFDKNLNIE